MPREVFIDANRLKQVLLNLLSNAIKFTKSGHVILKIQNSYSNLLNFSVIDSGVGIASDDMSRVFEEFQMLGDFGSNPTGSGFGLTISNRILEAMGGTKLKVSSVEN